MHTLRTVLLAGLMALTGATAILAQDEAPAPRTLRVAVKEAPPFVLPADEGDFEGISIELWRAIAERLGFVSEFDQTTLEGLLEGVADGRYDVGVAATTVTAERERTVDFSHPFFSSGLGIATTTRGQGLGAAIKRIFSLRFVNAVAGLALLLLVVGLLVWWFERRTNPEEFEPSRHGLWSGFWFAAVSMTTVGYGDKAPRSVGGRIITLVWMFASIIVISFFTAAIATALTVHSLETPVRGPQDLPQAKIGSVESTTSARYLEGRGLEFAAYTTAAEAVEALAAGKVEAVVYDRPILRWLVQSRDDASLKVLANVFDRQDYALVLAQGSPLREEINQALLEELQSKRWPRLLEQYLGD